MLKKFLAATFAIFFAYNCIGTNWVWADAIDDAKAQKQEVDRQVQLAKQRYVEARRRAEKASSDFHSVVQKLDKLQKRSTELTNREDQLHNSLADNDKKLALKKEELKTRRIIYRKRLADIYKTGQINYLDVLLGAEDFGDFISRMYLLDKVVHQDIKMLDGVAANMKEVKERSARQTRELKEVKSIQEEIAQAKFATAELKEKRAELLSAAQKKEQQEKSEYDQWIESSAKIAQLLKEMEKVNPQRFTDKADNFIWPCCGPITSYAGWRIHPVWGTKKYHSGMDIGVDYYVPIKAANRGTVTYAGWMDGYGNLVMIDHGEGLVTLYAHNSSIKVNEGQFVHQGDVVALAGATGWATGPHCHFEVRVHGEVVDPLHYISEKDNIY